MSSFIDIVKEWLNNVGGSGSGLTSEEKAVITWQNSAGQVVRGRMIEYRRLEKIAQAHIDSYDSYVDTATPESRLQNAKSVSEMFAQVARGAKVVEDIQNGNGQYRFTVHTERGGNRTIV